MSVYSNIASNKFQEASTAVDTDGLLAFMCEASAADTAMFNSIIELDFQEAFAKINGGSYITESEEGIKNTASKIFGKILELLKKAWNTIKTAFETFIAKIMDAFGIDKKLADKYGDISGVDFSNCEVKVSVPVVKNSTNTEYDTDTFTVKEALESIHRLTSENSMLSTIKDLKNCTSTDQLNQKVEEINKTIGDIKVNKYPNAKDAYEIKPAKDAEKNALRDTLKSGYEYMKKSYSNLIKDLNDAKKSSLDSIKEASNNAKTASKNSDDKMAVATNAAIYKLLSSYCKEVVTSCSDVINLVKYEILSCRGTYIRLGKWYHDKADSNKKEPEGVETSSAVLYGLSSDLFVESVLDI